MTSHSSPPQQSLNTFSTNHRKFMQILNKLSNQILNTSRQFITHQSFTTFSPNADQILTSFSPHSHQMLTKCSTNAQQLLKPNYQHFSPIYHPPKFHQSINTFLQILTKFSPDSQQILSTFSPNYQHILTELSNQILSNFSHNKFSTNVHQLLTKFSSTSSHFVMLVRTW